MTGKKEGGRGRRKEGGEEAGGALGQVKSEGRGIGREGGCHPGPVRPTEPSLARRLLGMSPGSGGGLTCGFTSGGGSPKRSPPARRRPAVNGKKAGWRRLRWPGLSAAQSGCELGLREPALPRRCSCEWAPWGSSSQTGPRPHGCASMHILVRGLGRPGPALPKHLPSPGTCPLGWAAGRPIYWSAVHPSLHPPPTAQCVCWMPGKAV